MKKYTVLATSSVSPLWDSVKELYESFDIDTFRAIGGVNDRLATWSAKDSSTRYYKSLIYEFALYLNDLFDRQRICYGLNFENCLSKIKNQNLGSPPTIRFEDYDVSLDYLSGLEEFAFCSDVLIKSDSVCEIGAGFGRTCHTLLSLSNIKNYTIIDLPELLAISELYLSQVLNKEDFDKITFLSADSYEPIGDFDLAININSLQEMPIEIGSAYLELISDKAHFFFTKNVMGKYSPTDIDLKITNQSQFESAMQMGLMTDKMNLFDTKSRAEAVKIYHKKFCPNGFSLGKTQRGFGQHFSYELSMFQR